PFKTCLNLHQDSPRANQYQIMRITIAMRGTWPTQILVNYNPIIQASIKSLAYSCQRLQIRKYFVFLSGSWSNESSHIQIPKVSNQVTRTRIKRRDVNLCFLNRRLHGK